jgi:phosphoglycolate phosphatase
MADQPLEAAGILLDLDGTLVESVGDLTTAINRTLAEFDRTAVAEDQVRNWVGEGVRLLVKYAMEATGGCDETHLSEAHERFMVHYGHCFTEKTHPFPEVVETLRHFREAGVHLGVVTNKPSSFTEPLLEATGLRDLMDVVVSGDTAPAKKPDPAPVFVGLDPMGIAPEQAVFVGDSRYDVEAGLNAGCQVVCVTYGYNRGEDVYTLGAHRVVTTFGALREVIRPALAGA